MDNIAAVLCVMTVSESSRDCDNVFRKVVHQHDTFLAVDIQLINEAKPVNYQTRAEPPHKEKKTK